jgi:hypothetical protein
LIDEDLSMDTIYAIYRRVLLENCTQLLEFGLISFKVAFRGSHVNTRRLLLVASDIRNHYRMVIFENYT